MNTYQIRPGYKHGVDEKIYPETVQLTDSEAEPFLDKLQLVDVGDSTTESIDFDSLSAKNMTELREIASVIGVDVSGMKKAEMVDALIPHKDDSADEDD